MYVQMYIYVFTCVYIYILLSHNTCIYTPVVIEVWMQVPLINVHLFVIPANLKPELASIVFFEVCGCY